MKRLLLSAAFACTLFCTAHSQDKRAAEIDRMMQFADSNRYFNGALAVVEKGRVIYSKGFGYADMSKKEKNDVNTLFNLCSISKQFTAMCIMLLKEENKLGYEDALQKYFPELPYKGITIRHLLNHTSGLPDYMQLLMQSWSSNHTATNADAVRVLAEQHPPELFAPGERFEYCNTGYVLLANIVEKVSGKSFESFLQERIFRKLGMKRSTVYLPGITPAMPANFALPYAYDADQKKFVLTTDFPLYRPQVTTLDGIYGDGGIYSTVTDMLAWDKELRNISLVKKETLQEAFTSGKNNEGKDIGYGFGWFTVNHPTQGKLVQHTGGWPGYRQAFIRFLDKDWTLLVLRNTEIDFRSIQEAVQNILEEKPWKMPTPSQAKVGQ